MITRRVNTRQVVEVLLAREREAFERAIVRARSVTPPSARCSLPGEVREPLGDGLRVAPVTRDVDAVPEVEEEQIPTGRVRVYLPPAAADHGRQYLPVSGSTDTYLTGPPGEGPSPWMNC